MLRQSLHTATAWNIARWASIERKRTESLVVICWSRGCKIQWYSTKHYNTTSLDAQTLIVNAGNWLSYLIWLKMNTAIRFTKLHLESRKQTILTRFWILITLPKHGFDCPYILHRKMAMDPEGAWALCMQLSEEITEEQNFGNDVFSYRTIRVWSSDQAYRNTNVTIYPSY